MFAYVVSFLLSAAPNQAQNVPILSSEDFHPKCSSVLIHPNLILTAAHCIDEPVGMVLCMGHATVSFLTRVDRKLDLALLELDEPCSAPVTALADNNPELGDDVWALGCPAGKCTRVTKGIVSSYEVYQGKPVLVTDTQVWHGNSGGGLFNEKHELVGICSQFDPDTKDGFVPVAYAFFVPIKTIHRFLAN